jgi:hypothetical protein
MKMRLKDMLNYCEITLQGKVDNKEMVADSINEELEHSRERAVYCHDITDVLCSASGGSGNLDKAKIFQRYISHASNPHIKDEYGIEIFHARKKLAKEGFFGDLGLENRAEIRIKSYVGEIINAGNLTLFAKSEKDAEEFVKKRVKLCPPVHNIALLKDPVKNFQTRTPIEKILIERGRAKVRAVRLLRIHGIKTAEYLTTYSRFAFRIGGNFRTDPFRKKYMESTLDYLEECLDQAGLSFSPESSYASGRHSQADIYNKENAKNDILKTMNKIGRYATLHKISCEARKALVQQLERWEMYGGEKILDAQSFAASVFASKEIKPLIKELIGSGKVENLGEGNGALYRSKEKDKEVLL